MNRDYNPPGGHTDLAHWINAGEFRPGTARAARYEPGERDGNGDLYRQAARYIRRPAPKRDPWLTAAVTAWAAGSAIAVILAAEQNTPWWLTALIPATVLVTIGLVRAMDR